MAVDIALSVDGGDWPPEADLRALAEKSIAATAAKAPALSKDGEVSILFTDDAHIAELNAEWRGIAHPTNVLSFPAAPVSTGWKGPVPLGDIVLGFETMTKEAAAAHLTLADHISHLLVHGLLHLVGFDHQDDAEAAAMESLETAVLAELGIADPYAGREPELIDTAGNNGR
jgi:probable rRNA maturation factor